MVNSSERYIMPTGIYERTEKNSRLKDISGQRFGKLIAIKRTRKYKPRGKSSGVHYWLFKCDCGREKEILMTNVTRTNKSTKSCGCERRVATEYLGSKEKVNFLRNGLRRLWLKWPPRYHTVSSSRVDRGKYLCVGYGKDQHIVGCKDIHVDHINPVGQLNDWNAHINKLFCSADNLQILCKKCHKKKTKDERSQKHDG